MKKLLAHNINTAISQEPGQLHAVLDRLERHELEYHLWSDKCENGPTVRFCIAHNGRSVLLKFFVREDELRTQVTNYNGPVWEDSCVEFFVSFDTEGYYNFECNAIGTVLAAFGKNKKKRQFLPEHLLCLIRSDSRLYRSESGYFWEMVVVIPCELFIRNTFSSLSGLVAKGNFYKCGDRLSRPHFLAWADITADHPDFHLPQFFGTIVFES